MHGSEYGPSLGYGASGVLAGMENLFAPPMVVPLASPISTIEPTSPVGNEWQPPFLIREDENGKPLADRFANERQNPLLVELALLLYDEGTKFVRRAAAMRHGLRQQIGDFQFTRISAIRDAQGLLKEEERLKRRLEKEEGLDDKGDVLLMASLDERLADPKYRDSVALLETIEERDKDDLRRLSGADAEERKGRGLQLKAQRQITCGIYARQFDGSICGQSRAKPFRCKNRYCPQCAPTIFKGYLDNYSKLGERVEAFLAGDLTFLKPEEQAALAPYKGQFSLKILDLTTFAGSEMPSPGQVQEFEQHVKKLQRRIAKHFHLPTRLIPYLYCDEFGHNNTNLHCHGILLSPYIELSLLSEWWKEIRGDGSYRVLINEARNFRSALAHALEYTGKWSVSGSAHRAMELELAFHGVRRVHALGWFHSLSREPGEDDDGGIGSAPCPCGTSGCVLMLRVDLPYRSIAEFERLGIPFSSGEEEKAET